MKNDHLKIDLNLDLVSKQSVLAFIYDVSDIKDTVSREIFLENLKKREEQGSIEVAEGVILPHFELAELSETQIIIVRPRNPLIDWSLKVKKVDVVVALLYKTGQGMDELKSLMRMLADDSFIEDLKKKDVEELTKILRSKLCK